MLDKDLEFMTRSELKREVVNLRKAIRNHRDSTNHDLCWYHPDLWMLLPEKLMPVPNLPPKEEFLERCNEFHTECAKRLFPETRHTLETGHTPDVVHLDDPARTRVPLWNKLISFFTKKKKLISDQDSNCKMSCQDTDQT